MTHRLLLSVLFCGAALALASCSDPGGVGANLGDRPVENDSVITRSIAVDSIGVSEVVSTTGLRQDADLLPRQSRPWRFLFGAVDDPLSPTITAEGYVDFEGTATRDSAFVATAEDPDSLDAELRLQTTYLHGDTSSTLDVQIYDLAEEADMDGAPADTTFPTEMDPVRDDGYQVSPTDSLLTFDLPQPWIEEHQDVLRDSVGFGDAFNGLRLASEGADVVVGVEHASATLRVTTSEDTVDFRALKSFTRFEQTGSPSAPLDGWTRIQDGVGQRFAMRWDFDRPLFADTLRNFPLNGADMVVPIDTNKMEQEQPTNPDFVRPSVNNYRVLGNRASGAPSCGELGLPRLSEGGAICLLSMDPASSPGAARVAPQTALTTFEEVLLNTPVFTTFQVGAAVRENVVPRNTTLRGLPSTLPALVRTAEDADPEARPHVTLTYTPL